MKKLQIFMLMYFMLLLGVSTMFIGETWAYTPVNSTEFVQAVTTLPTNYDLREYIDIPVENQSSYNICFSYASLTSAETYLAKVYNEYYDFSELHFALSLYLQDDDATSVKDALDCGGNFSQFNFYAQKDKSLMLEQELPLSKYSGMDDSKYAIMEQDYITANSTFHPIAKVNDTIQFPKIYGNKSKYSSSELTKFRNSVKQHLMEYGSLTACIYSKAGLSYNDKYFKVTDDSYLGDGSTNALNSRLDHMISIIGWDDNYNANGTWSNPGAYLCLNSWGEGFGDNGCFYVSYDDYFIEYAIQGVTNVSFCTSNTKISPILNNQQDTFISIHTVNESKPENDLYIANVLDVSSHINSTIEFVDLYVKSTNSQIYIKFYSSYSSAVSGISNISYSTYIKPATKISSGAIYDRFELNTPLKITNNYAVIISRSTSPCKTYSMCTRDSSGISLSPTYCSIDSNGYFDVNNSQYIWDASISEDPATKIIPTVLHINDSYLQVSSFTSDTPSFINLKYIKNNAICYNKTLNTTFTTTPSANNIKITKLGTNDDFSSNFSVSLNNNVLSITMIKRVDENFTEDEYLVAIPTSQGIVYRVFEVQQASTYSITYHLDGGEATNPSIFTPAQETLVLNNPSKAGYNFIGWYLDEDFTQAFHSNNLPASNLELWAKYDFAKPTISAKSQNLSITYSAGSSYTLSVTASHPLECDSNPLTYQWYYRKTLNDEFYIVDGATNSTYVVSNVVQSGYYACEITLHINDPALTSTPCVRVLSANTTNQIVVNIKPFIYDMSTAEWNYQEPFSYDTKPHSVTLINLPDGVTATYTNNKASEINTYTAHATLIYDTMNGNAIANEVADLIWQIRPSKITIAIKDIVSEQAISNAVLTEMFDADITHEYIPSNITTLEALIVYLELEYELKPTEQSNIYIITASTKTFDIHDIEIINGEYRIVLYEFASGNISTNSKLGFVKNCEFSCTSATISDDVIKQLDDLHLKMIDSYNISYSYLHNNDVVTMNINLQKKQLLNPIAVYILKNGKLYKANDINITTDGISFTSTEANATYLLVQDNLYHTSNSQYIVFLFLGGGFVAIYIYIFVHRRHKRYKIDY